MERHLTVKTLCSRTARVIGCFVRLLYHRALLCWTQHAKGRRVVELACSGDRETAFKADSFLAQAVQANQRKLNFWGKLWRQPWFCWQHLLVGRELTNNQSGVSDWILESVDYSRISTLLSSIERTKENLHNSDVGFGKQLIRPRRLALAIGLVSLFVTLFVFWPASSPTEKIEFVPEGGDKDTLSQTGQEALLSFEEFRNSTIAVSARFADWEIYGDGKPKFKTQTGTGVVLSGGLVLTNRHNIDQTIDPSEMQPNGMDQIDQRAVAKDVTVFIRDPQSRTPKFYQANIIAISKKYDLALLQPTQVLDSNIEIALPDVHLSSNTKLTLIASPNGVPADEKTEAIFHSQIKNDRFQISNVNILKSWSGSPLFLSDDPTKGLVGLVNIGFGEETGRSGGIAVSASAMAEFFTKHRHYDARKNHEFNVTVNSIEVSKKAVAKGHGGFLDDLYGDVYLIVGYDKDRCEKKKHIKGELVNGKGVDGKKLEFTPANFNLKWKPHGIPLRIEIWENDDLSGDDLMDYLDFNSSFPQDARFPWRGTVTLTNGSKITFNN